MYSRNRCEYKSLCLHALTSPHSPGSNAAVISMRGLAIAHLWLIGDSSAAGKTEMTQAQKPKSPILIIVITLAVGLGGGAAAMAFFRPPQASQADAASKVRAVLHLETFTVDIGNSEQKAYLRVGIDLGLGHDIKSENGDTPTALVRDTLLTVLMSSKPDELVSAEGKRKLKEQILDALHQRAPELSAKEVYFTEFLLQR